MPNWVHWGCTMGEQIRNQNYNDQEKQEGKNKKNEKRPHSNQRECAGKKTLSLAKNVHDPQSF